MFDGAVAGVVASPVRPYGVSPLDFAGSFMHLDVFVGLVPEAVYVAFRGRCPHLSGIPAPWQVSDSWR